MKSFADESFPANAPPTSEEYLFSPGFPESRKSAVSDLGVELIGRRSGACHGPDPSRSVPSGETKDATGAQFKCLADELNTHVRARENVQRRPLLL